MILYKVGIMLDKIKLWLYKYNVLKKDTLVSKIDYLLLLDIDLNNIKLQYVKVNSFSNSITEYTDLINFYLDYNLEMEHIDSPRYNRHVNTFYVWYNSNNKLNILTNDELLKWLNLSKQFTIKINGGILLANLPKYQSNSIKLKPYIIDIERIVNGILDNID